MHNGGADHGDSRRITPTGASGSRPSARVRDAGQGGKLGAGVDRVEGRLEEHSRDSTRISVERTRARLGGWTYWQGESVVLSTSAFARFEERKLSATRTAVAVASVVAVAAKMLTTGLFGIGGHDPDPNPRPTPPVQPGFRW